jgi:hypothetical protein
MCDVISVELAQRLQAAGLQWEPRLHDFFMIPDTHFSDRKFVITDVQAELALYRGTPMVTFHGALEWALDHVQQQDVVWLPTETQLREALADRVDNFTLERNPAGYTCTLVLADQTLAYTAESGGDAYAEALLFLLFQESMHGEGTQPNA